MPGKPFVSAKAHFDQILFASHDNDRKIPRTRKEIYDLNGMIATEMENIFLKKGVPVIPSLGRQPS